MVQSKRAYQNEIKNIKAHEKEKKNKYIETLLENKDVRFWREWRKIKARSSNNNNSISIIIIIIDIFLIYKLLTSLVD